MKQSGKTLLIAIVVAAVLILAVTIYLKETAPDDSIVTSEQSVTLANGARVTLPAEFRDTDTRYFGNAATGDVDGDDRDDVAFLVTQDTDGSGTFYYVLVARNTPQGYVATNAILLGDRISPQSTHIQDGKLVVAYADRALNEPMTTKPTIGKSKTLTVRDGVLSELAP